MSKIIRFLFIGVDKTIHYLFIVCCALIIGITFLLVLYALICGFIDKYRYEHGLTYVGAKHKYFTAMKEGNGPDAVYWIKKTMEYAIKEKDGFYEKEYLDNKEWLGYAYELNHQYEEALQVYQEFGKESKLTPLDIPRVKYKLGQTEETFQGYCPYANDSLVKYREPLTNGRWNDRENTLLRIRCGITMEHDELNMQLSPFLEYKDFLDFMEEEYKKLGEPPEYAKAMKLFRAIRKEISGNSHPRDIDAELLVKREQILAERRAKGVKW